MGNKSDVEKDFFSEHEKFRERVLADMDEYIRLTEAETRLLAEKRIFAERRLSEERKEFEARLSERRKEFEARLSEERKDKEFETRLSEERKEAEERLRAERNTSKAMIIAMVIIIILEVTGVIMIAIRHFGINLQYILS
ncbi:hypothetical protein AZF37_09825 (plasmid) [endosymbiont 'TC1' of Trimyema compressum]|uniref:hypothetical protein n=1 Tax=endosymbiont 'TC1' of Trimyema compressum TaxID=243899 RepID=UPI0007F0AE3F|nr:hypothetical protein [endosymbiont 'TC1' of Trimyema compressum]AMP21470.1 hypothetical protein AZF37_09825 [endosymbiont 'TC1' of Trimyema compressum]